MYRLNVLLYAGILQGLSASSPDENGLQCPTWTLPVNNHSATCECADTVDAIIICDPVTKTTYMHLSYCMGYIEESDMTVFGSCVYNNWYVYSESSVKNRSALLRDTHAYYPLPRNKSDLDSSCGYLNRRGLLCGKCLDGFSPPLLSYDLKCMECSDVDRIRNWFILLARVVVPTTLFYAVALLFQLSLLSPKVSGFILFAQFISSPSLVRQIVLLVESEVETSYWNKNLVYAIISMYSWSNLDFFSLFLPPICDPKFSSTISVFVINFLSLLYPVLLIILTYLFVQLRDGGYRIVNLIVWPCRRVFLSFRRECNIRCSIVNVFASLLLISYVRFLSVSLDMLTAVRLSNIENKRVGTFYWNYDASLEIFGGNALPVTVPSLLVVGCVLFLPTMLLCGCSVRFSSLLCKRACRRRSLFLSLQAFLDAFQGCYKDGTEPGTCNCRFVASLNLFVRVCLYLSYTIILGHHYFLFTSSLTLVYAVFITVLRPYKRQYAIHNVIEPLFLMLFCLLQISIYGIIFFQTERRNWISPVVIVLLFICIIPLVYMACLVLHWFSTTEMVRRVYRRIRSMSCRGLTARGSAVLSNEEVDAHERSFNAYIIGNSNYGSINHGNRAATQVNRMVVEQNS
jgi:hypothetical protein